MTKSTQKPFTCNHHLHKLVDSIMNQLSISKKKHIYPISYHLFQEIKLANSIPIIYPPSEKI
jgi:hypothetical protein